MKFNSFTLCLFLIFISCKKNFVHLQRIEGKLPISAEIDIDNSIVKLVTPCKNILEKDMNQMLAYAPVDLIRSRDMVKTKRSQ